MLMLRYHHPPPSSLFPIMFLQVSRYLALVCVLREEYFLKRSLLDYNINCLRSSLASVLSTDT